jgi:hypothetical protein
VIVVYLFGYICAFVSGWSLVPHACESADDDLLRNTRLRLAVDCTSCMADFVSTLGYKVQSCTGIGCMCVLKKQVGDVIVVPRM